MSHHHLMTLSCQDSMSVMSTLLYKEKNQNKYNVREPKLKKSHMYINEGILIF